MQMDIATASPKILMKEKNRWRIKLRRAVLR
jgi:hypothetical protein